MPTENNLTSEACREVFPVPEYTDPKIHPQSLPEENSFLTVIKLRGSTGAVVREKGVNPFTMKERK